MNGEQDAIDRPLRDLWLWIGILGPPTVWLIQFQSIYLLVYRACGSGRNAVIGATCLGFFVLITLMAIYPWRTTHTTRDHHNRIGRTRRFMSLMGVMSVALFDIVLIAQWIAAMLIDPCVI